MGDVTSKLVEILGMVAPEGMIDAEDKADFEAVVEGIGLVKIGLYRLFERSEKRGHMPRWVDKGNGRKTLDTSAEPTPEEREAGEARIREMVALGTPPGTPVWNPETVCSTTGLAPEQAAHMFPTRASWQGYLKAAGKVEVGGSDLNGNGGGLRRPSAASKTTKEREQQQGEVAELLKRAIHLMEQTGQVKDAATGETDPSKPLFPLAEVAPRNRLNGGLNGTHAPNPTIREIAGEGGLDADPANDVEVVPMHERAPADVGNLTRDIGIIAKQKGIARAKALGV